MGLLGKSFLFLLLALALFFLWMQIARADAIIDIVNATVSVDSSNVFINLSGHIYQIPVTNTTTLYFFQQNFSILFESNFSNVTVYSNNTITTFINLTNSTFQVNCNCPQLVCPLVVNTSCNNVSLDSETKTLFFSTYQDNLKAKIEESTNKVTADLKFALEPTRVELEGYKQLAFNSSIKQKDAEASTAKCNANNLALTGVYESCNQDKRLLQVSLVAFFTIVIVGMGVFFAPELYGKFRGAGGGGQY